MGLALFELTSISQNRAQETSTSKKQAKKQPRLVNASKSSKGHQKIFKTSSIKKFDKANGNKDVIEID